jgi:hypothetical protein
VIHSRITCASVTRDGERMAFDLNVILTLTNVLLADRLVRWNPECSASTYLGLSTVDTVRTVSAFE